MKLIRALSFTFAIAFPVAAVASPAVRAACTMNCCGDICPMHCPFCPGGAR